MKKPVPFLFPMAFSLMTHGAVAGLLLWVFYGSAKIPSPVPAPPLGSVVWMKLDGPEESPAVTTGCRSAAGTACGQKSPATTSTVHPAVRSDTGNTSLLESAAESSDMSPESETVQTEVPPIFPDPSQEGDRPPEGEENPPALANEGDIQGIKDDFARKVQQTIEENKPRRAKLANMEGTVTVEFVLGEDRKARRIRVVRSSGHALLDELATKTIRNISQFPEIPEELHVSEIGLSIPLEFRLED